MPVAELAAEGEVRQRGSATMLARENVIADETKFGERFGKPAILADAAGALSNGPL